MKHFRIIYIVVASALWIGLSSCGEIQTPYEIQRIQNREEINSRRRELETLTGEFEGTIYLTRSARTRRFRLNISLSGEPYPTDRVPDETTAPTLSAAAYFYTSDSSEEFYTIVPFDRSDYDKEGARVLFYSQSPEGALNASVLENENVLEGEWSNAARGSIGRFRLRRVR